MKKAFHLDLRQLDYFLGVARRGKISAAALDLNVTQPTLTKCMKQLEADLGVQLFRRLPRGVELTDYGATLLRHADLVKVQIQDALSELENRRLGQIGSVSIGVGPAWLENYLPTVIANVLSQYPSIKIDITSGYDDVLLPSLRRGDLDLVVAELPSAENAEHLEMTLLSSDSMGICCREDHPLTKKRSISSEDLTSYPWAIARPASKNHQRLRAMLLANNIPYPEMSLQSDSLSLLFRVISESDMLTYTASSLIQRQQDPAVVMLHTPWFSSSRQAGIITRARSEPSPAAAVLIEQIKRECPKNLIL